MRGGKNTTPDLIKIAQGTFRKDRAKKNQPVSEGVPDCPFKAKTIAARKWNEIVSGLTRLGLIDKIDATHIEGLCFQYQVAKMADAIVDKEGMVMCGARGTPMKHPAIQVSSDAWSKVRHYCNDLGLNHLSRQRMSSTRPAEETDKESKYLA